MRPVQFEAVPVTACDSVDGLVQVGSTSTVSPGSRTPLTLETAARDGMGVDGHRGGVRLSGGVGQARPSEPEATLQSDRARPILSPGLCAPSGHDKCEPNSASVTGSPSVVFMIVPSFHERREGRGKRTPSMAQLLAGVLRDRLGRLWSQPEVPMAKTEDPEPRRPPPPPGEVTRLLLAWRQGDRDALDRLIPLVYAELHRMAERYLRRERAGHTLQPTAIVNEAYLRLIGRQGSDWQNRAHFFAVAAQSMRRILVEHARRRDAKKRGGEGTRYLLDTVVMTEPRAVDLIALDDALAKLTALD